MCCCMLTGPMGWPVSAELIPLLLQRCQRLLVRAGMFDNLSQRLDKAWDMVRKDGKLTSDNIKEPMREIRRALLEADVRDAFQPLSLYKLVLVVSTSVCVVNQLSNPERQSLFQRPCSNSIPATCVRVPVRRQPSMALVSRLPQTPLYVEVCRRLPPVSPLTA